MLLLMLYAPWALAQNSLTVSGKVTSQENNSALPGVNVVAGSTGTQLLDQAITDLETAAASLPVRWDEADRGRITSNAANGLLGKALVFRATVTKNTPDYTTAIAAFNRITGVSLVPDFGDNFFAETENNAESLFEFQASSPGSDNVWLPNDFNNTDGSMSAYWVFTKITGACSERSLSLLPKN